jgi:hypothetical protein
MGKAHLRRAPRLGRSTIMYLIAFPLLLIPFALYNMIAFLLNMPFTDTLFSIPLIAGRRLPVTTSDLVLAIAMLLLYVEVLKVTRVRKAVIDHVLSGAAGHDADPAAACRAELRRRDHRPFRDRSAEATGDHARRRGSGSVLTG